MSRALSRQSNADVLACADVLGSFGVTGEDVSRNGEASLEDALAEALADARDRTAFCRRTICRSTRGIDCTARYPTDELEAELAGVFTAFGWSFDLVRTGDRLTLSAADRAGRSRETTIEYPETPLGTDNLPAVLHAINEGLLTGVDGRFVLLSSGVDRWRAALVETDELERVREAYGDRIAAVERPLLPAHGVDAYVPDAGTAKAGAAPWPDWALERVAKRRSRDIRADAADVSDGTNQGGSETLIEEAESTPATPKLETCGFEVAGSPTVSRSAGGSGARAGSDSGGPSEGAATRAADEGTGNDRAAVIERRHRREPDADGFGRLSGSAGTARVSNDSFGSGIEPESDDERFRALGAALETGRNVSVRGLLHDDDFLPAIPAAEPETKRLQFDEEFDPAAVETARASAEHSGFEWVDSGSLETKRVSNG